MQGRRRLLGALSLCLILLLLFGYVAATAAETADGYDYSRPGSVYNKTVTGSDILEGYLGEELSTVETEYLVKVGGAKIEYDDGITTSYVTATVEGEVLTVHAREYSYTSSSGGTVVWTPLSAELSGSVKELAREAAEGSYSADFPTSGGSNTLTSVTVKYALSFTVAREDVNSLINKAYLDAPVLREEIAAGEAEYRRASEEYLIKSRAYEEYLSELSDYKDRLLAYDKYLIEYNIYKEATERYNAYVSELELYEAGVLAHEKYLADMAAYDTAYSAYAAYLAEKRAYDTALESYEDYLLLVDSYRAHLAIIDFTKTAMTPLGRTLYNAINGTTVDLVLRERDTIESELGGGVPAAVIDLAGSSTERLRELMSGYFASESEESKYYYYATYYEDFKEGFCDLLTSLDYLYSNRRVRGILIAYDKDEQYRILLAQLCVIANALTDGAVKSLDPSYLAGTSHAAGYKQYVFDSSYRIDNVYRYTVDEVLYGEEGIPDTGAAKPFTETFPAPKSEPTAPPEVKEPRKPDYVSKPVLPEPVDMPGDEPTRVENPGDEPTRVENPGDPPTPYAVSDEARALVAAYEAGELSYRYVSADEDFVYTVTKSVEKKIGDGVEEVTAVFYDADGKTHLYSTTVDRGTAVSYGLSYVPQKPEDARASYVFVGWENERGETADLSCVYSDVILYPRFEERIKEYSVTWSVDGRESREIVPYGQLPTYSGETAKSSTELYIYTFMGWDKDVVPVTGDVTYTARFAEEYIIPTSEGGGRVTLEDGTYAVNLYSTYDTEYRIGTLLIMSAGRYGITLNTRYATLTLSPGAVAVLFKEGAASVALDVVSFGAGAYSYCLTVEDVHETPIKSAARVGLLLPCRLEKNDRLGLYYEADGGAEAKAQYTLSDSRLGFTAAPGRTYELRYEYKLSLVTSGLVTAVPSKSTYTYGESIDVELDVPVGVRVTRIYMLLDDGTESDVMLSRLTMPMNDVKIIVEAEYVQYKIVFSGDDTAISTQYCKHGELPKPPSAPKRASDGSYRYEFDGWSSEIEPATRNTVYFAVYNRIPIEKDDTGGRITAFMLIHLALSLVFCLVFFLIPATVINVRAIRRFKAERLPETPKTE